MQLPILHISERDSCNGHTNISKFYSLGYPWSIEFDENIFLVIENDIVIGVSDNNGNGTLLFLGNGFTLDAGLQFATYKTSHKFLDIFMGDLFRLIKWVFLIVDNILDSKSGPCLLAKQSAIDTEGRGGRVTG